MELYIAERTAKACLLVPDSVANLEHVVRLAERAVTGTEESKYYDYFLMVRGLAEYRAGHYSAAIDWLRQGEAKLSRNNYYGRAFMQPEVLAKYAGSSIVLSSGDLGGPWHDWLQCQILRREAEAIVKAASK